MRERLKIGQACDSHPQLLNTAIWLFLSSVLLISLILNWKLCLTVIASTVAVMSALFSVFRLVASCAQKPKAIKQDIENSKLPYYTVLVPLFNEDNMVGDLMTSLEKLDYPKDKLEICLICEAIDPQTIAVVRRNLRRPFKLIIVPKGKPQTKPRALNYALKTAHGEIVTIYDAEDRPHISQLKRAAAAFKANPNWQALQAPLEYYNTDTNWLTRQFTLEYAALFHVWVPFLARLGLPFPLGGTSNHIRKCMLDKTGGWDAYNVTEDADLSFRIAALSGTIGYITPPTQEEAVANMKAWHFQRSRWLKGFMQSWNVHMGAPILPYGLAGLKRLFTLQLTIGFTLLSIWFYVPTIVILLLYILFCYLSGLHANIPVPYVLSFVFSILVGVLIGVIGAVRAGKPALIFSAIYMPFYWALLFAPSLRAIWELRRQPFHWHKTRHGVSSSPELKSTD